MFGEFKGWNIGGADSDRNVDRLIVAVTHTHIVAGVRRFSHGDYATQISGTKLTKEHLICNSTPIKSINFSKKGANQEQFACN